MANFTAHLVDNLGINEVLNSVHIRVFNQGGVLDVLDFTQFVTATLIKSPHNQSITQGITVTPLAVGDKTKPNASNVHVAPLIKFNVNTQRSITQTLIFQEYVVARLERSYHYVPPEIPTVGAPSPSITSIISPVFTLSKNSDVLELRLPKFGDKDKYEATRVKRNTRGGTLIIYRDPRWPEQEILSVEFEYLSSTQVTDLLTFMHAHLGQKVHIKDQYSREFDGFIITPEAEVTQPKRIGYSAKFDFQIYQVPPT